jgi:non-specific serine/threonine protein kinase
LREYDAVRLFIDRAVASVPQFAVTGRNAPAVSLVCHRLDGIPLAIELAAARVKVLAVEQIATRLDDRFRLLTGGSTTALPRQQTLRATTDWSYDLLLPKERAVLRRLSVFTGGWTLEGAEAVCVGEGIEASEILDLLTHLVDKSLVVVETHGGEARYRLLETVRQYGLEKLSEAGEDTDVRTQHRDWYLALAEQAGPELHGPRQELWLERLETEHDNMRAALEWTLTVGGDTDAALQLAGWLGEFWFVHGHYGEGIRWLDRALSHKGNASPGARRWAVGRRGLMALILGQRERAAKSLDEALVLAREVGDKKSIGWALFHLGYLEQTLGNWERSRALILEGLTLFREVRDDGGIAASFNQLGELARSQGDYVAARELYQDSVVIHRKIGDKRSIAITLVNLGFVAMHQGGYREGGAFFREALSLNRNLGYKKGITTSITGLAGVALAEGQPKRGARLLGAAEFMLETIGGHFDSTDQADHDRFVVGARAVLGGAALDESWADGRGMTLEQAIEYALAPDAQ